MLILGAEDVRQALPMRKAIELMKEAFAALTRGDATVPPRTHLSAPDANGITLVMPARVDRASSHDAGANAANSRASHSLAVKIVSVFDGNPAAGLPRIQGAVVVLEPDTGRPLGLVEGAALTAIRTAAASGAATDLLAPRDASTLAVLGAGVQARSHVEAMCAVRPISTIRIYSRTAEKVDALIRDLRGSQAHRNPNGHPADFSRVDSAADAVREADVICATTTSPTPVFEDNGVKPGAHINAVGSFTPEAREIPGATVARSWVVVDDRDAAWAEAGDLIQARNEGLIDEEHIRAELGELALDPDLRPTASDQPTLFKSVGVAVQDAVAAAAAVEAARRRWLGTEVLW